MKKATLPAGTVDAKTPVRKKPALQQLRLTQKKQAEKGGKKSVREAAQIAKTGVDGKNPLFARRKTSGAAEEPDANKFSDLGYDKPNTESNMMTMYNAINNPLTHEARKRHIVKALFFNLDSNGSGKLHGPELLILDNFLLDEDGGVLDIRTLFDTSPTKLYTYEDFEKLIMSKVVLKDPADRNSMTETRDGLPYWFFSQVNDDDIIQDSWRMWLARPKVFYSDYAWVVLFLFFQLVLLFLAKWWSPLFPEMRVNGIFSFMVVTFLLIGLVMLTLYESMSYGWSAITDKSRENRIPFHLLSLIVSYMFMAGMFLSSLGYFGLDPLDSQGYGETLNVFWNNLICSIGICLMSIKYASYEWKLAEDREGLLIRRYAFRNFVDKSQDDAGDVLVKLFLKCERMIRTRTSLWRYLWLLVRNITAALLYSFAFSTAGSSDVTKAFDAGHKQAFLAKYASLDYNDPNYSANSAYDLLIFFGAATLFFSTIGLEICTRRQVEVPLLRNKYLKTLLMDLATPSTSMAQGMNYCPLHYRDNIKCFYHVEKFISKFALDRDMDQAILGFEILLVLNVALVALSAILYVSTGVWKNLIMLVVYCVIITIWCLSLIQTAVDINMIHVQTMAKISEYQSELRLLRDDEHDHMTESPDVLYGLLGDLKSSLDRSFKPISVLGIKVTQTLATLFYAYLLAILLIVISKSLLF